MPRKPAMTRLTVKIISLRDSVSRRMRVEDNLRDTAAFHWEFFDALTQHTQTSSKYNEGCALRAFGRPLTAGEIGCYKSHIEVLRSFVESGSSDWVLVLEDDVFVDIDFNYKALLNFLTERKIGYLRLYAKQLKSFKEVCSFGDRHFIRFISDPYGTQAYVINKEFAARFIGLSHIIDMPIDDKMGRFWKNGLIPYAIFPFPVMELSTTSTIAAMRTQSNSSRINWTIERLVFRGKEKISKYIYNILVKAKDRLISSHTAHSGVK